MIVKMPDGTNVSFPDDMPKEQIKSLIASKFPEVAQQTEKPAEKPYGWKEGLDDATKAFEMTYFGLPSRAAKLAIETAPAMLESGVNAVTAPMRAMTGELPMTDDAGRTSPDAIAEAFNMATWATPNSPAMLPKAAAEQVAEKALPTAALKAGEQVAQSARNIGVTLPRAVTSDSASVQQMGKIAANVPIAGQPLRNASKTAISQLDDAARRAQDSIGSGDRVLAGDRVRTGLQEFSKKMDEKISGMEEELSAKMQPDKISPLPNTRNIAAKIQKERFTNANKGRSKALAEVEEALSRDGMTFEGLRGLRTKIRNLMDVNPDALTTSDFEKAELKRLYGALTDDLKLAAQNAGGKAARDEFEKVVAKEFEISKDREALERVLGRNMSDEALSDKLFRMAGDKSTANIADLAKVRQAVSDETWDELASSVVSRMGRTPEGMFTPERFSTEWGKLSDGGKSLLFRGETRKALDDIAAVSSRFKKLNEYANPSGSGMSVMGGSYFAGAYMDPMSTVGALIGANVTARLLAKPASAKAVADYAKAYELAARAPGQSTQNNLANKSRALALIAANGNEQLASNLAARMATIQQTAAQEEGSIEVRQPEGKNEATQADPALNEAILQGRAF